LDDLGAALYARLTTYHRDGRWGQPTGPQLPGHAAFLDLGGKQRVVALLRRKYGLLRWIIVYSGHTTRGRGSHTVIRVTLL